MQDETEGAEPETHAAASAERSGADAAARADDDGAESAAAETEGGDGPEEAPEAAPEDTGEDEADEASSGEAALKDQLLRALADAENARRRARKDVEEARAYAISRFAQDLLGVADNLSRALENIPAERREDDEAVKAIAEGVEMTARDFEAVLGRHGITRIDPLGERFDYNLHQALYETADTDQPDGTVVQVLQTGYRIGERLLREAMVGVAKGGTQPAGEAEAEADTEANAEAEAPPESAEAPADDPS